MQPTKPTQPTIEFLKSMRADAAVSTDPGYDMGRSVAAGPPRPTRPVPGEMSTWADVARFVGLLVPSTFTGPAPSPQCAHYPSLTADKSSQRKAVKASNREDGYVLSAADPCHEAGGTERWFLHASACERLHSLHPTAPRASALCNSPSADASAVGKTGTVVYLGDNRVLTAFHVWAALRKPDGTPMVDTYVVFGYADPTLPIAPQHRSEADGDFEFNGWVRPVTHVVKVTKEHVIGPGDPQSYRAEHDWVVLEIECSDLGPPPFEIENMRALDWVHGRAVDHAADGSFDKKDLFELGDLAIIGHPLGVPKRLAEGGSVKNGNGRVFQHEVDSFSGNSGAPIFRPALGAGPKLWLVGINLGGHDLVQVDDHLVPAPGVPDAQVRPGENLAIDIREVLQWLGPVFPDAPSFSVIVEEKAPTADQRRTGVENATEPSVVIRPHQLSASASEDMVVRLRVRVDRVPGVSKYKTTVVEVDSGSPGKPIWGSVSGPVSVVGSGERWTITRVGKKKRKRYVAGYDQENQVEETDTADGSPDPIRLQVTVTYNDGAKNHLLPAQILTINLTRK